MRYPYTDNMPLMKLVVFSPEGEKEYDAYLDIGASKTLIPESDAHELGLPYSGEIPILTGSGEDILKLYSAEVAFLEERRRILVLGRNFPESSPIRSIIGRDILDDYKVCFNGREKVIEIIHARWQTP